MKQKRSLTLWVVTLLTILSLNATYSVFKVKGNIGIRSGSKVRKAEKRAEIKPSDYLIIPQGGEVKIMDTETKMVYSFDSPGIETLSSRKKKAEDKVRNIIARTNGELRKNIDGNAVKKPSVYRKGGISIHNTDAIINVTIKLPEGMSYLGYLMSLTSDSDYDDSNDALLLRRDLSEDKESFGFAVFNTTSEPLYYNVIRGGNGSDTKLLFEANPLAKPKGETVETEHKFAVSYDKTAYILVASTENFTSDDLHRLLDPSYEPAADYYFSMLFK